MIKKIKLGLIVAMFMVLGAGVTHAANLTYTDDTFVTINSRTYYIGAGSGATTVDVNPTTLVAVIPASTSFTLKSLVGDTLANDGGVTTSCSDLTSVVTIASAGTVTFTPTSVQVCSTPAPVGGGSQSGGGGGGGGGNPTPVVAQSTTPVTLQVSPNVTMTTVSPGCSGGNLFNTSTGAPCNNNSVGVTAKYNFGTKTLKNGSTGEAVKELQRFLNAKLGLGLKVDGKLGPKTVAIIKKWQKENGLKADGLIGAKTKALMNSMAQ